MSYFNYTTQFTVDNINEKTPGAGVTIENIC